MLTPAEIREVARDMMTPARQQWAHQSWVRRSLKGQVQKPWMPANADAEYKDLYAKSAGGWLEYIARIKTANQVVEGFTHEQTWHLGWQANRMDSRQKITTGAAIRYGYAFLAVLPGAAPGTCVMRPMHPLTTFGRWADPWDDYPLYVMHRKAKDRWVFIEPGGWHSITGDITNFMDAHCESVEVGLGVTPCALIRGHEPEDDDELYPRSRFISLLPAYKRVVDATFTVQMLQRYAGFPQKWASGLESVGAARVGIDSLLLNPDPAGSFGTFAAASVSDNLAALNHHIHELLVTAQIPAADALNTLVNIGADGITASRHGSDQDDRDRRDMLADGYEDALRLAAAYIGDTTAAGDYSAQVEWRDTRLVPLSAAADAFTKFVGNDAMTPRQALRMLPGFSARTADEILGIAEVTPTSDPNVPEIMRATPTAGDAAGTPTGLTEQLGGLEP